MEKRKTDANEDEKGRRAAAFFMKEGNTNDAPSKTTAWRRARPPGRSGEKKWELKKRNLSKCVRFFMLTQQQRKFPVLQCISSFRFERKIVENVFLFLVLEGVHRNKTKSSQPGGCRHREVPMRKLCAETNAI